MTEIEESEPEVAPRKKSRERHGFVVSWLALTVALTVIAVAAIATLIIVATVANADTLATVALVLAILAFGAQLIVTAAQTATANEQYRQVNRLYEDTRAVLQRIRVQSKMLLSNQSDQFNKILDHVLSPGAIESAVAEARGESDQPGPSEDGAPTQNADVNEVSKLLRAEAERALAEERAKRTIEKTPRRPLEPNEVTRFPREDEGREAMAQFMSLSPEAKDFIRQQADRAIKNPRMGIRMGQIVPGDVSSLPSHIHELSDKGFIELEPYRREGRTDTGRRITPLGVTAIRFFTGQGVVPDYLREVFEGSDSASAGAEA